LNFAKLSPLKFSLKISTALVAIFLAGIFVINPFGLKTASERYNQDLIIRYLAPLYGTGMSEEIVIFTLDDLYIENTSGHYPVPYNDLSRLLKSLQRLAPKAVFFDLVQHYEHSSGFEKWTGRIEKSDFPVMLGSSPRYDDVATLSDPSSLRYKLNNISQLVAVSWQGYGQDYPLQVPHNDGQMDTPALALYKSWCKNNPAICKTPIEKFKKNELFQDPMIVKWSNEGINSLDMNSTFTCQNPTKNYLLEIPHYVFRDIIYGISSSNERDMSTLYPCPQIQGLSALELVKPGATTSPILKKLVKNKIIMIGYDLEALNDRVISPINGSLPGVYYHAVALENLMLFGNQYWHVPKKFEGLEFGWFDLLNFIILIPAFGFSHYYRKKRVNLNYQTNSPYILVFLFKTLTILIVILSISLFISYTYGIGIVNIYALFGALSIAFPTWIYVLFTKIKVRKLVKHQTYIKNIQDSYNGVNK